MKLTEQVASLAAARTRIDLLEARIGAFRRAFDERHGPLLGELDEARKSAAAREIAVRSEALASFLVTGSREPAPGVKVRLVAAARYDPEAALLWARAHGLALRLDAAAFEKLAVAGGVPVAEVFQKPVICLATDLSAALAGVRR
jgi:hypothetical protein